VTNPLENDCKNANTLAHDGEHLVVSVYLQKKKLLVLKRIKLERKRRRKVQVMVVRGPEVAT
jgi:hypothetical protein